MKQEKGNYLHKGPCSECGSSDACATYSDGHTYCFSCGQLSSDGDSAGKTQRKKTSGLLTFKDNEGRYADLPKRGITVETCRKHGYWVGKTSGGKLVQVADYVDSSGETVGQKIRGAEKNFSTLGNVTKDTLWGSHLWAGKGKKIVVTEGEIDCLSVSQLQGLKWPVVSLPNGAHSAAKACAANYEYLDGYDEIILMFDQDEPGRAAVSESAEVLPTGKVKVAHLPLKDANECLLKGLHKEVLEAIWNATPWMPEGIHPAKSLIQRALSKEKAPTVLFPICGGLNDKTLGLRDGEVVTLTSGTGMGKSTFAREVAYGLGFKEKVRIGMAFIEESVEETMLDMTGLHMCKRIRQLPDSASREDKEKAMNELFDNDRYFLYDHFGSTDETKLLNKLRYMITAEGCRLIILDHISIVVSGMEEGGDERKAIDRILTAIKTLAKNTGAIIMVVVHLKRKDGKGGKTHEEGGRVTLGELRGSGSIAQLSDTVIGIEGNQQGDKPNTVTVRVLKCRFTGDTGVAGELEYCKQTGRLLDLGPYSGGDSEGDTEDSEEDPF